MNGLTKKIFAILLTGLGLFGVQKTHGAEFFGLGDLPGGTYLSGVYAVSADGSTAVGFSYSLNGEEASRWTQSTGMVGLGDLSNGIFLSDAWGVSANGSVITGIGNSENGNEGFYWTQNTGMIKLADLPGIDITGYSFGISSDGNTILGRRGVEATYWTQSTGMVGLGDLPGGNFSSGAIASSANGSVITGYGTSSNGTEAFRWTQSTGMVGLGDLPGGLFSSIANDISSDGSVIVGYSKSTDNRTEAFRWTQSTGMVGLGAVPGLDVFSVAYGTSADGSIVVGTGHVRQGSYAAFIWDSQNGFRDLQKVLTDDYNLNTSGWYFYNARAISADGKTIVGNGRNPNGQQEAWMARLTLPTDNPPPMGQRIEASSIPQFDDSKRGLVFVTHGWSRDESSAQGNIQWVNDMISSIQSKVDTSQWDIVGYDWTGKAGGFNLKSVQGQSVSSGVDLGEIISEKNYESVHLIAHSLGSPMIDQMARLIKSANVNTVVHVTFLDAFTNENGDAALFGAGSDWSEHYFSNFSYTHKELRYVTLNRNVSILDPNPGQAPDPILLAIDPETWKYLYINYLSHEHGWPVDLYIRSINGNTENLGVNHNLNFTAGFPLSREFVGIDNPWNPPGIPRAIHWERTQTLAYANNIVSNTGVINIGSSQFDFATGSPVWVMFSVQLDEIMNALSFDLIFTSQDGAEGLLAVYLDDVLLASMDERYFSSNGRNLILPLSDSLSLGEHFLKFRLDPFTDIQSSAKIENVTFGYITAVPEPSSILILAIGFSVLIVGQKLLRPKKL